MKLVRVCNQIRRDCWIDIECEGCEHQEHHVNAYDDRNFWDNVLPNMKCKSCGKSTIDLRRSVQRTETRYPDDAVV